MLRSRRFSGSWVWRHSFTIHVKTPTADQTTMLLWVRRIRRMRQPDSRLQNILTYTNLMQYFWKTKLWIEKKYLHRFRLLPISNSMGHIMSYKIRNSRRLIIKRKQCSDGCMDCQNSSEYDVRAIFWQKYLWDLYRVFDEICADFFIQSTLLTAFTAFLTKISNLRTVRGLNNAARHSAVRSWQSEIKSRSFAQIQVLLRTDNSPNLSCEFGGWRTVCFHTSNNTATSRIIHMSNARCKKSLKIWVFCNVRIWECIVTSGWARN